MRIEASRWPLRWTLVLLVVLCSVLLQAEHVHDGAAAAAGPPTYAGDFPDPSVLRVGQTYYAYATNTGGAYVPVLRSDDLQTWSVAGARPDGGLVDALPTPAAWGVDLASGAHAKETWAPGVFSYAGRFIAFYALRMRAEPRRTCISVATSDLPTGPFVDASRRPVVCDADPLGSIDPQPYVDPVTGLPYLTWKSQGQAGVRPTRLWAQRLAADGTGLLSGSRRALLLQTARAWEGPIIENPSMVAYGGSWWLFYSGNDWAGASYAVGYARCATPLGPCRRASAGPLLQSFGLRSGPGGASAFADAAGHLLLSYHYWSAPYVGYDLPSACSAPGRCASQGQRRLGVATVHLDGTGHLAVSP